MRHSHQYKKGLPAPERRPSLSYEGLRPVVFVIPINECGPLRCAEVRALGRVGLCDHIRGHNPVASVFAINSIGRPWTRRRSW